MELQQANNLAKNTHKNVKKIAKTAKPNYLSNDEFNRFENDVEASVLDIQDKNNSSVEYDADQD